MSAANARTLVHRARSRSARIAARTARPARGGRERRRIGAAVRADREHRQQLLQIAAPAARAGGRLAVAGEELEVLAARAALVFVERHSHTLLERAPAGRRRLALSGV